MDVRYAIIVGCVLAGALGTSCGDIAVVPADGGAGKSGGAGGRGGVAGNAAGSAGTGPAGAAGAGPAGAAGTGPAGTGGGGRGGGAGGNTAGTAGTGPAGAAGTGPAGAGGGGRGGGAAGNTAGTAGTGPAGAAGTGPAGAGGGGRGGAAGNAAGTTGTAGTGPAGAGGGGGAACRRELLTNAAFDLGPSSWSAAPQGTRLVRRFDDAEVAAHQVTAQSSPFVLRLGAPSNNNYVVHYVEQYANIPSDALELTISGHLQVRTEELPDDVYDEAYVVLFDESLPASPFFRSAPRWSNLTQASGWTPFSFPVNVGSVAGKEMVFRIVAELDTGVPTYFYFDTLSVAVTRCSP
jgi:hypothetical protein